uniref:RING-type domain-containing protein n=1 Tax=Megaviridae environmental sample TaxID=1737588 RepID=A0A5J6VHD7_9VIRU|nr:MAG: hypothetical protein [Megaviridae environmental sample]
MFRQRFAPSSIFKWFFNRSNRNNSSLSSSNNYLPILSRISSRVYPIDSDRLELNPSTVPSEQYMLDTLVQSILDNANTPEIAEFLTQVEPPSNDHDHHHHHHHDHHHDHNHINKIYSDNGELCVICQHNISEVCYALECEHMFHIECLNRWIDSNSNCPLCRHEITSI